MSLIGIAGSMGVTTSALQDLIQGHVRPGVAGEVGCTSKSLQQFVDGGASIGLAGEIGTTSNSLQELRDLIGDKGAIGLLIGLAIGLNKWSESPGEQRSDDARHPGPARDQLGAERRRGSWAPAPSPGLGPRGG